MKMTGRGAAARRIPENDTTIAYVQADGLVCNIKLFTFNEKLSFSHISITHTLNIYRLL